jgi:DNA-binding transcriptional ArsR family regulator
MSKITKNTKNKIINKVVQVEFGSDQTQRVEATAFADNFLKGFGIYVGLYNKINGTALSVESALWEESIMKSYQMISNLVRTTNTLNKIPQAPAKIASKAPKSTKKLSYEAFQAENGTSVAHLIYAFLKNNEPMTRTELATRLKLRLSTVCGQIVPLQDAGLVSVIGTKIDEDSNRTVEILKAA